MAKSSDDFKRFLYANYPDDYRRATVDDVPDDVLRAIYSRHEKHYKIWQSIPEWIKTEYRDKLPKELFNGNTTVKQFVEEEKKRINQQEKETKELMDYSVTLLALGYAVETVATLSQNRAKRMELISQSGGAKLSAEQMVQWLALRESDKKTLEEDWKKNNPEKYLLYLFKELSRAEKRGKGVVDANKKAMIDNDIKYCVARLNDKAAKERMIAYLRQAPQQSALKHLSPKAFDGLYDVLKEKGIRVCAFETKGTTMENKSGREVLTESLKKQFACRLEIEKSLAENFRENKTETKLAKAKNGVKVSPSVKRRVKYKNDDLQCC